MKYIFWYMDWITQVTYTQQYVFTQKVFFVPSCHPSELYLNEECELEDMSIIQQDVLGFFFHYLLSIGAAAECVS